MPGTTDSVAEWSGTGIRNKAPNQEDVGSIPAAGSSRKVFIGGGNSNGFSFPNLTLSMAIPPTRPKHQLL